MQEIPQLLKKGELSFKAIAGQTGVSSQTVSRKLDKPHDAENDDPGVE